ncbi:hypothetical protein TCAL_15434 [Tigriopus californicus]|uniref:Uncharacterized protein n=1 Tax=Tigriopus californicus TaxID=6832 RepID=A0A553PRD8_TIGCA|nr:hypothetical protein TCAL_15434 [Tigriopus californicus]
MYAKDLLNVANQLEPGLSKWRGQLLFEMQSSNEIFEENLKHLTEAVSILQVEPDEKEKLHDELKALSKAMDEVESAV